MRVSIAQERNEQSFVNTRTPWHVRQRMSGADWKTATRDEAVAGVDSLSTPADDKEQGNFFQNGKACLVPKGFFYA